MTGYLTVSGLDGFHRPISSLCSSNEFQILLCKDGRRGIEVRSLAKKIDISYLTFDGVSTYCVRYRDSIFGITNGRPGIIRTEPFTNHRNNACISAGGYPFDLFDEQARSRALWLAFGAGLYLRNHPQKSMPLPWQFARWDLRAYGFRIEYELAEDAPYTVRSLTFIRSTALDLPDSEELKRPELDTGEGSVQRRREDELRERRTVWQDGFVAGTFQASERTNCYSIELPLRFSLRTFNPQLNSSDKLFRKFEGIVTNVTEVELSHFSLPPIMSKLLVIDERRRYDSPTKKKTDVHYDLKPGEKWYGQDASLVTNLFEAGLRSPASDKQRYVSKHAQVVMIRAALLISLILPALICFKIKFALKSKS